MEFELSNSFVVFNGKVGSSVGGLVVGLDMYVGGTVFGFFVVAPFVGFIGVLLGPPTSVDEVADLYALDVGLINVTFVVIFRPKSVLSLVGCAVDVFPNPIPSPVRFLRVEFSCEYMMIQ